ncbi:MAG: hypothetical protein UX65_C0010G0015 [Parcubacteria group bacterium GW2011_GWB1_46_8]|nr:MAG: hypothetical protein UX65_C0010G0015 [Parcubacteria group bacterium GW2011_GWB1_46_8]
MSDNIFRRQNDIDLNEIKTSLSSISQSLKTIEDIQDRHSHILFGRDEAKGGLIMDVDRLVQHKKNTDRSAYVIFTTAIGLVAKIVWDAVFHK